MGLKVEFRNYFGISRPKEDFNLIWTICFLNHIFRVIYLGSYIFAKSFQNYAGGYVPTIFSYQKQPPEVFCKKGVLRNSAKFIWKHLCQSLFFNKETFNFVKKRLWHRFFPVNFVRFLKTPFSQNTSGRLLLLQLIVNMSV